LRILGQPCEFYLTGDHPRAHRDARRRLRAPSGPARGCFSGLGVSHSTSVSYGDFVWAWRPLSSRKRRFPARAVIERRYLSFCNQVHNAFPHPPPIKDWRSPAKLPKPGPVTAKRVAQLSSGSCQQAMPPSRRVHPAGWPPHADPAPRLRPAAQRRGGRLALPRPGRDHLEYLLLDQVPPRQRLPVLVFALIQEALLSQP
jgi:hypothetical protein